jgi:hypothetical protein
MEMGASPKWTNNFESEDEMITVMNCILARQKKEDGDVRQFLNEIRGGDHYFFDLDLIPDEAETLGWNKHLQQ